MEMFEDMDDLPPPTLRKPLIDVENLYIRKPIRKMVYLNGG